MKRQSNGEISVYSTSAIDLFCSAMGVFMLICFIAFAQIKEETPPEPPPPEPAPPEPAPPEHTPPEAKRGLPEPMMVAVCKWETSSDVDMCVHYHASGEDPCWFAFGDKRRTHSERGFYGGLLRDDVGGGSNTVKTEQWALFATHEGEYEVYLSLFGSSSPTDAKVNLMTEDEVHTFSGRLTRGSTWLANSDEVLERDYRHAVNRGDLIFIGKFVVRREGNKNKVKIETTR